MRRRCAGVIALAIAVGLVASACDARSPAPTGSAASATSPSAVPAPPIAVPSLSTPPSAAALPSGVAATARDPGLLAILPTSVGGVSITEEPDSFTEALADPAFSGSTDRAIFVIAVSGNDLASGVVAHLRPGVYSDKMFSDWRSSYDQGACAQSGGVVSHAQVDGPGGTTYVTTCGGGLRVFHTYLPGKGVIVSLFSTGDRDFGGTIMSQLKG